MSKKLIFDKKNILVTGGAGFIGSHLCDELVKENKVICLDNFSSGSEKNIDHLLSEPNFVFIRHDINEPIELETLPELIKFKIEFQGIQEIYHLACPMSPKNFEKNKIDIILANSLGTKNVLDLAKKYNAKFLHYSSSVVYGYEPSIGSKVSEDYLGVVNVLSNRGAYDEGKRFAETLVANYGDAYKLDVKIMRLFRTFGPRMPLNDGHMIPDFISDALDNKDLSIFGNEKFISSFCYISDVIDASLKLMDSELHGPYNIGSDREVSIIDVANSIIRQIGSRSLCQHKDPLLFMKPLHIPDIARARNELGWMPIVSIDKGLEYTIYDLRASKGLRGVESAL